MNVISVLRGEGLERFAIGIENGEDLLPEVYQYLENKGDFNTLIKLSRAGFGIKHRNFVKEKRKDGGFVVRHVERGEVLYEPNEINVWRKLMDSPKEDEKYFEAGVIAGLMLINKKVDEYTIDRLLEPIIEERDPIKKRDYLEGLLFVVDSADLSKSKGAIRNVLDYWEENIIGSNSKIEGETAKKLLDIYRAREILGVGNGLINEDQISKEDQNGLSLLIYVTKDKSKIMENIDSLVYKLGDLELEHFIENRELNDNIVKEINKLIDEKPTLAVLLGTAVKIEDKRLRDRLFDMAVKYEMKDSAVKFINEYPEYENRLYKVYEKLKDNKKTRRIDRLKIAEFALEVTKDKKWVKEIVENGDVDDTLVISTKYWDETVKAINNASYEEGYKRAILEYISIAKVGKIELDRLERFTRKILREQHFDIAYSMFIRYGVHRRILEVFTKELDRFEEKFAETYGRMNREEMLEWIKRHPHVLLLRKALE